MWNSILVTVAAGTPVRFAKVPTEAQRLRIRPLVGTTPGVIYVLNQNPAETMVTNAQTMIDELPAATASIPGGLFALDRLAGGPPINVQEYGLDGAHTADTCAVSWEL